jgi:lipopolysaccharide export system protein LptA
MTVRSHRHWSRCWALLLALAAPAHAAAQNPHAAASVPSPATGLMQGQSSDQPVQIEAKTLEVHDKIKTATFSGDVKVVQGDTTMHCQSLVVFYGQEIGIGDKQPATTGSTAAKPASGMPQGAQNIRRIEAHGGVTVITKDQNASGELGVYDMQSKTITLSGNVVVSQGQNVIHGERVVVDTVTGNARVESAATAAAGGAASSGSGRVRALIQPGKGQNGAPGNFMTIGPGTSRSN